MEGRMEAIGGVKMELWMGGSSAFVVGYGWYETFVGISHKARFETKLRTLNFCRFGYQ
jgi:hypothetical protein